MTAPELAADGAVIVRTLASPGLGVSDVAARGRSATALAVATLAALAFAAVALPRVDWERAAAAGLDRDPKAAELTPTARDEKLATARRVGELTGLLAAAASPALLALGAAGALWAGFRVAGARPGIRPTLAVTAHGMLPVWLSGLLAIPAAVLRAPIPADELPRLLPSSAAALLGRGAPPPLVAALASVDLFALWAVVLVATGMGRAAGTSRRRALAVTAVLFLAWIAVAKIALPAALAGGTGPGPRGGP